MSGPSSPRILIAALLLAAGGAAAALGGVAPVPALALALAGAGAAFALRSQPTTPPPAATEPERKPPRPTARDLMEAFPEPVLIVRDRRVALANSAARAVLGAGIDGEDVRLAIRHPIAAERLVDPAPAADEPAPAELVGLGEADRRWTMATSRLADGARLVRLEDRSASYATEKMRTDFVANASHELRTPLATLLGFIETLEDLNEGPEAKNAPETRRRFLSIMHGEAKRMQRLVDDLISLSRVEAERFSVPREAHDFITLVEQAREEQRYLSEARDSPVLIDAPDELPAVAGDRPQLLQMADNLIANALKYGRPGTPVRVTISVEEPGMLRLTVADQGDGIPREHLPRITERFYRVDPSRSRAAGGTGLGLSIVKHVVERHRGRLNFHSEVGQGTTVTVALPVEAAATKALSSNSNITVTQSTPNRDSTASTPG